jgi:hypothetical protein
VGTEPVDYCREIETYLCRKNDGHLIRVVGPSFELVSRWASDGVPLKVAFQGIDRYFERYYRKGPRRRPVRIDFCEADVLDVFDEWRRAVGLVAGRGEADSTNPSPPKSPASSLATHLERALVKLTHVRVQGTLGPDADPLIDRVSAELDTARSSPRGLRGDARRALTGRLEALDRELLALADGALSDAGRSEIEREAADELAPYRERMDAEAYALACEAAAHRLVRSRFNLPTLTF